MSRNASPARLLNEEAKNIKYQERVQNVIIDELRQALQNEFAHCTDEEKTQLFNKAAEFVGDRARNRIIVKDMAKETMANFTDGRWLANAVGVGIIGGVSYAAVKAVARGIGSISISRQTANTTKQRQPQETPVEHRPSPYEETSALHRASPTPTKGSVSRLRPTSEAPLP